MDYRSLEILYYDRDIIVALKPYGVSVETSMPGIPNLPTLVSEWLIKKGEPGSVFMTHRLDVGTAGICLLARNTQTVKKLTEMFSLRQIHKTYLAVLDGIPDVRKDMLTQWIFHDSRLNKSFVSDKKKSSAKEAKLSYEVCEENAGLALAKIELFTGRTHQIRAQMASIHCPLFGDKKYGSRNQQRAFSLLAYSIRFEHPKNGQSMYFEAPFPNTDPFCRFSSFSMKGDIHEVQE